MSESMKKGGKEGHKPHHGHDSSKYPRYEGHCGSENCFGGHVFGNGGGKGKGTGKVARQDDSEPRYKK